jgi:hypothetical protein
MSPLCSHCDCWESERDGVCQLCWLSLSIRQVSRNRDFGRGDFTWAVDQLSQVLGTLTSRILIEASPALKREEEHCRRKTGDHSPPSSPKRGSLAKEPSKPRKEGKEKGAPVSLPPALLNFVQRRSGYVSNSPCGRECSRRKRRERPGSTNREVSDEPPPRTGPGGVEARAKARTGERSVALGSPSR